MAPDPRAHRPPRPALDRRTFLRGSFALALGATAGSSLLAACGGSGGSSASPSITAVPLARPDNPVTLPLYDDNPAIADGLAAETGGVFKILNYENYMDPGIMKSFGKKHGVSVQVTPYDNYDGMLQKIRAPGAQFDLVFPGPSVMSKMALAKLVQPLNKSYLPNYSNLWPQFDSPFYDVGGLYTVPYTVYTTGVGYRADLVDSVPSNGYDLLWDTAFAGKVYLLDDDREAITMSLLRNNLTTDVNTEDASLVNQAVASLTGLLDSVNVKLSVSAYSYIPDGTATIHQCWSGDMISAQYYLKKGVSPDVLGYWVPDTNRVVGNDCIAIPKAATKPVLAHMLINDLLDNQISLKNFGWNGYQPPLTAITPQSLVTEGYVPGNLKNTVVLPSEFKSGLQELELSPAGEATWQNAWSTFKAGA